MNLKQRLKKLEQQREAKQERVVKLIPCTEYERPSLEELKAQYPEVEKFVYLVGHEGIKLMNSPSVLEKK